MLALLAALCFLADLLGLSLGDVELTVLGWLFVALHLAFGAGAPLVFWRKG
jgi:hypothetical protein